MNAILLAALALAPAQPAADKHDEQNPLFKRLMDPGLDVGPNAKAKFPAPTMADGLTAAKQKEIIKSVIGTDYSYDEFVRDSVVAPQILKIGDLESGDKAAPARAVDVWFVVYGDFKQLEDDKFLDKLVGAGKTSGGGKGGPLAPADLAKRKIEIKKGDEKREGYGTVEFDFLEKVRLTATGHAMWSRNGESVVAAAEIDPRFRDDKEFPNQWRSITKAGGQTKVGDANPWGGAAVYLKVTKLAEPAGALFVEQHIVFAEPTGWFDGANLLRSKLPIAVQDNVRTMRKQFKK
ncbi:hypothetical protein J8F10_11570 [Gemmata sp. G18]|uniref:Uncharacterized protein n=1 Tax=Gemmata palustris TaxID=2822762 RepID=A0ABS5BQG3_9BACT|nr:hypothetical protein [Gemmata palustris]MBP3955924.1 hypothetical protein [Gemmata palustris]